MGLWMRALAADARLSGLAGLLALHAALIALPLARAWSAGPAFPELTGRIVDDAGLISAEDRAAMEAELEALEARSTDQIAVLTTQSLQGYEIEDYGYRLGRHWGIGQKDKDNGAILIVAVGERKVRIEVGRGLEPHLTDAMSRLIIDSRILPAFRRGDYSGGIRAGVQDMKDVLLGNAEAVKERAGGAGSGPGLDWVALVFVAIWIAIFLYVMYAQYRHARQSPIAIGRNRRVRQGRWDDDGDVIVIPGGSGRWDSGGWDSGGGWSGGGGDFGGGGASGSW